MRYVLAPRAARDLRSYLFHVRAATDAVAAMSEQARIESALSTFAEASADGRAVEIPGWPRPLRRHDIHPFHVFDERRDDLLYIVRCYHHARRPLEA